MQEDPGCETAVGFFSQTLRRGEITSYGKSRCKNCIFFVKDIYVVYLFYYIANNFLRYFVNRNFLSSVLNDFLNLVKMWILKFMRSRV